jgi:hypothetical protein
MFLAERIFNPVNAALDLVVDAGYLSLENITVRVLARVADLLVAVGAGVHVRLLRAHVAAGHDRVRVRVRQFS